MIRPSASRVCWVIPPLFSADLRSCGHLHAQWIVKVSRLESDSGSNDQLAVHFRFREPRGTTYRCAGRR
jgi:hypothetical protein